MKNIKYDQNTINIKFLIVWTHADGEVGFCWIGQADPRKPHGGAGIQPDLEMQRILNGQDRGEGDSMKETQLQRPRVRNVKCIFEEKQISRYWEGYIRLNSLESTQICPVYLKYPEFCSLNWNLKRKKKIPSNLKFYEFYF